MASRQLYRLIEALLVRLRVLVQVGGDVPRHGLLCSLVYDDLTPFPVSYTHLLFAELLPPELGGVDDASLRERFKPLQLIRRELRLRCV